MKLVYTTALALAAMLGAAVAQPASIVDLDFSSLRTTAVATDEREVAPPAAGVIAFDVGMDGDDDTDGLSDSDVGADYDFDAADSDDVAADADMDFATEHNFGDALVRHSLLESVNTLRTSAGLAAVCVSYKLLNTAQSQAYYMARTNNITVISEDGFTPSHRGRSARFNSTSVAEVLGAGYTNASAVVRAWLTSSDVKSILLGNFTHIGPGYAVDATQPFVHYWVVDLAHSRSENCSTLTV